MPEILVWIWKQLFAILFIFPPPSISFYWFRLIAIPLKISLLHNLNRLTQHESLTRSLIRSFAHVTQRQTWTERISFVFSCNQAALWMVQSVRPSVQHTFFTWFSPSVRLFNTPFSLCSHHHIIMKFLRVITIDRSDVHAKSQGHRAQNKFCPILGVSGP